MKLGGGKQIRGEDFPPEYREVMNKLGFILNPFIEQLVQGLQKRITISENLNQEFREVTVQVDSSGVVINTAKIQTALPVKGINVERVLSVGNTSLFPVSAPFCSWVQNQGVLEIQHVTGLAVGTTYKLVLLLKGS